MNVKLRARLIPLSAVTRRPIGSGCFTFSGDADSMVTAREVLMGFLKPYFSNEVEEFDVFITLQEALANAVMHGCRNDASKTIHCAVAIDRSAFTITIRDPGPGFDVEAVTQPAEAAANVTQHRRGICLMRSVMDEVAYQNGGSELQLRKVRKVLRSL